MLISGGIVSCYRLDVKPETFVLTGGVGQVIIPAMVDSDLFKELAKRPFKSGEFVVFRLWSSSYYPAWAQRFCEDEEKEKWWWRQLKDRNLLPGSSMVVGDGSASAMDGELWVYKLQGETTTDGLLFLAQMHLRKLYTKPDIATRLREVNKPVPEFDLSLISTRALAPNFQQVTGMSNPGMYPHIYTVDDEGSKWSHHVEQNWRD